MVQESKLWYGLATLGGVVGDAPQEPNAEACTHVAQYVH